MSWCDLRESRGGVACVGASPWGPPHPRKAKVSQKWPWMSQETPSEWPWMTWKWPWMSRWDGASVGASPKVFQGGEASDGASPYESRWQARGVPGW